MPYAIQMGEQDAELRAVEFTLRSTTDGSPISGQAGAVAIRLRRGGVESAGTGTVVEPDPTRRPGLYLYRLAPVEVSTLGPLLLRPVLTGAVPADWPALVISDSPYTSGATPGEVARAVWDEQRAGHSTAGSFGQLLSTLAGAPAALSGEEQARVAEGVSDPSVVGTVEGSPAP